MGPDNTKKNGFFDRFSNKSNEKADDTMFLNTDMIHEGLSDDELDKLLSADIKSSAKPPVNPSPAEYSNEELEQDMLENVLDIDLTEDELAISEEAIDIDDLDLLTEEEYEEDADLEVLLSDEVLELEQPDLIDKTSMAFTALTPEMLSAASNQTTDNQSDNKADNQTEHTEDTDESKYDEHLTNTDLKLVDMDAPIVDAPVENTADITLAENTQNPALVTEKNLTNKIELQLETESETQSEIKTQPDIKSQLSQPATIQPEQAQSVPEPILPTVLPTKVASPKADANVESVVETVKTNEFDEDEVIDLITPLAEQQRLKEQKQAKKIAEQDAIQTKPSGSASIEIVVTKNKTQTVNTITSVTQDASQSQKDIEDKTIEAEKTIEVEKTIINEQKDIEKSPTVSIKEPLENTSQTKIATNVTEKVEPIQPEPVTEIKPVEVKSESTEVKPEATKIVATSTLKVAKSDTNSTDKNSTDENSTDTNSTDKNSIDTQKASKTQINTELVNTLLKAKVDQEKVQSEKPIKETDLKQPTGIKEFVIKQAKTSKQAPVKHITKTATVSSRVDDKNTQSQLQTTPSGNKTMSDKQSVLIEKIQVDIDELKRKLHAMNSDFYNAATDSAVLISQVRELETSCDDDFTGTYNQSRDLRKVLVEARKTFNQLASGIDMLEESLETDLYQIEKKG